MELVWSPDMALKAYIDTVKFCKIVKDSSVAELVSAMAAGWNSKLIVETWSSNGGATTTSVGLAIASQITSGQHVCIVPDELSRSEYVTLFMDNVEMSTNVIVGKPEEVLRGVVNIDFLVLNCEKDDIMGILRVAKLGHKGAVIVCTNIGNASRSETERRWSGVVDGGSRRLVRAVILPVGEGLDIAHIGGESGGVKRLGLSGKENRRRWIKHIDRISGEEFVFRK